MTSSTTPDSAAATQDPDAEPDVAAPDAAVPDVPLLTDVDREAQQRFIAVVDVLVDADVELVVTSHHALDAFRTTMPDRPDAFRTASRLQLLAAPEDGLRPPAGAPRG